MYENDCSLQQLLELALRVPEIGAVNFNILYYVLKTLIEEQGLEEVIPAFSLVTPLKKQSSAAKTRQKKVPLKRSYSVDSLEAINAGGILKRSEKEDFPEKRTLDDKERASTKWDKKTFFKRLDAVEEEISEFHIMFAQLVDKISNSERVVGLQETKFLKAITNLKQSIKSQKEIQKSAVEEHLSSKASEKKMSTVKESEATFKRQSEESKNEESLDDTQLEQESTLSAKCEKLFDEINSIKKHLKMEPSVHAAEVLEKPVLEKSSEDIKDKESFRKKDSMIQVDLLQHDSDLLSISVAVNKLMEKFAASDKMFSSDISDVKEKNLIIEQSLSKCDEEIEVLKTNWHEMVHAFESIKEHFQYLEKQMSVLTQLPGLKRRVEQLEGYVYAEPDQEYESGEEEEHIMQPLAIASEEKLDHKSEKIIRKIAVPDKKVAEIFKPVLNATETRGSEEYLDSEIGVSGGGMTARRKFLAVSRNIALIRDMEKKRKARKRNADLHKYLDDDDDSLYDEPVYETVKKQSEDFGESSKEVTPKEMVTEYSAAKTSTFASPDVLEEHSRQLRGQVIVFVKKRLHVFEIDLEQIESNLVTVKKKIEVLEKSLREIGEKLMFMDANFNQRAGDLATLKEMAENNQVSIMTVMHLLDRKAEAYAVHQKVSRKELTVIEDRVVKLCVTTSSEISKLEEKISDSLEKFNLELDKKLFTEEFEVRSEFLLHKIKMLDIKLKDASVEGPTLDFEGIRPVEIKKFVLCKDGTRIKQARKKIATWKHSSASESIIPVLTQQFASREASPRTAIQIQKELEQASVRESKRYVEGAYTKIQVGRK